MKKPLVLVLVGVTAVVAVAAVVLAVITFGGVAAPIAASTPETQTSSPSGATAGTAAATVPPVATTAPSGSAGAPGTRAPDAGAGEPVFTSSSIQASVECPTPGEGPAGGTAHAPAVLLRWSSTGATRAFVGVATTDAEAEPYAEVAASGTESIPFPCPEAAQQYTVTLVGPGGATSTTTLVTNSGFRG